MTALNQTRAYGAADPTFTYGITGFVNGDFFEPSELNPQPTFNCTDLGLSPSSVGNYKINISPNSADPLSYSDAN